MTPPRAYFFGCWNEPGHYLFAPGGENVWGSDERGISLVDGIHLDANYAPRQMRRTGAICYRAQQPGIEYRSEEMPEGYFLRHERGRFTLIAWWDRQQGDSRGACNSTFLLEGAHDTSAMLAALAERFPHVVKNLKRGGVELREVHP